MIISAWYTHIFTPCTSFIFYLTNSIHSTYFSWHGHFHYSYLIFALHFQFTAFHGLIPLYTLGWLNQVRGVSFLYKKLSIIEKIVIVTETENLRFCKLGLHIIYKDCQLRLMIL